MVKAASGITFDLTAVSDFQELQLILCMLSTCHAWEHNAQILRPQVTEAFLRLCKPQLKWSNTDDTEMCFCVCVCVSWGCKKNIPRKWITCKSIDYINSEIWVLMPWGQHPSTWNTIHKWKQECCIVCRLNKCHLIDFTPLTCQRLWRPTRWRPAQRHSLSCKPTPCQ